MSLEHIIFGFATGLAVLSGIVYCGILTMRPRQIDDALSLLMTGALFTVGVGCYCSTVWLVLHFRTDFTHFDFETWKSIVYGFSPARLSLYLFGALLGHFLIYSFSHMLRARRSHRLSRPTTVLFCSALSAMAATICMTVLLWVWLHAAMAQPDSPDAIESRAATREYLFHWLESEPDSPHAQYLVETFLKGGAHTQRFQRVETPREEFPRP